LARTVRAPKLCSITRLKEPPVTTLLIGADATPRSEDAIVFGRQLAHATTADVTVASIVGDPAARADAHATVRRMSGLLAGVDAARIHTGVIESRSAAQGLHELAASDSAALLVVGSTHTGHLGRVKPGSTAERLLTGGPCAVAVVPDGYRTAREHALKRIGVAYDGSAEAKSALQAGVAAARALGAVLEVITVIPSDLYGAPALMGGVGYIAIAPDLEQGYRHDLEEAVAGLPADVTAESVVLEGRPWRRLAEKSAELDLLFVGSRGYGPLHAVILGGTSGALLREAQCPVIALPRGAQTELADLFTTSATAAA
jgi:nucleotide-binding universal stress UspA family protein